MATMANLPICLHTGNNILVYQLYLFVQSELNGDGVSTFEMVHGMYQVRETGERSCQQSLLQTRLGNILHIPHSQKGGDPKNTTPFLQ